MTATSAIAVRGLSVTYGVKRILTNVYMDVTPGRIYGVIGPNGAGKSTLFKAILGLVNTSAGSVELLGQPIEEVRHQVAYIPQRDDIDWDFPAIVQDVVMMGRYPHQSIWSRVSSHDHQVVKDALERMDIAHLAKRQIGELSGGQQQRVFIARALSQEADLLLLDEPFVGVDLTTEHKIIDILRAMSDLGKTILLVHHDLSTVREYFTDVILLNRRLVACGPIETYFTDELVSKTYGAQRDLLHRAEKINDRRPG